MAVVIRLSNVFVLVQERFLFFTAVNSSTLWKVERTQVQFIIFLGFIDVFPHPVRTRVIYMLGRRETDTIC